MHFIFMLLIFHRSHAQTILLAPIPAANVPSFTNQPQPVTCTDLPARLQKYSDNTHLHEQSLISFLNDVSATSQNWYNQLFPLEGQTETIPVGTFDVVDKGSSDIQSVTDLAAQNSVYLKKDLDLILAALSSCLKSATPSNLRR